MDFVRPFDRDALDASRFDFQLMADGEPLMLVACQVPSGVEGPAPHSHERDQLYFVLDGSLVLDLGGAIEKLGPGHLAYIAAGTPHHNWNDSAGPEIHLDMIVDPPRRGMKLGGPLTGDEVDPGTSFVAQIYGDDGPRAALAGQATRSVTPGNGRTPGITIDLVDAALAGSSEWQVAGFDQYLWLLEGNVSVEIATEVYDAAGPSTVVIPAGVAHRITGGSGAYLALRMTDTVRTQPVNFATLTGATR